MKGWEVPGKCLYYICSLQHLLTTAAVNFMNADSKKLTAAEFYTLIQTVESYVCYLHADKLAWLRMRREKLGL